MPAKKSTPAKKSRGRQPLSYDEPTEPITAKVPASVKAMYVALGASEWLRPAIIRDFKKLKK